MINEPELTTNMEIFSVSELNLAAKSLLEDSFGSIWVQGELSNVAKPNSGHIYFTIKDDKAQVRCAMFRHSNKNLKFKPEDGQLVLVKAHPSIFEPRGDYQLIIEQMKLSGEGMLQQKFEQLKKKLLEQGLFDKAHKKPIPSYPQKIGIITSPTGAAVHDILNVLNKRFSLAQICIYPTQVQGARASAQIVSAIQLANTHKFADIIILARGGGSLEDLWPFNEENVANAIFKSKIPIVTGVGHETDITIADFVADLRAATPSHAAESISPDSKELFALFQNFEKSLINRVQNIINNIAQRLDTLEKRLQDPRVKLINFQEKLLMLQKRMKLAIFNLIEQKAALIKQLNLKLLNNTPQYKINEYNEKLNIFNQSLIFQINKKLNNAKYQLTELARTLDAMSPLATINRGYAIVRDSNNNIIKNIVDVNINDTINTQLQDGVIVSKVININN